MLTKWMKEIGREFHETCGGVRQELKSSDPLWLRLWAVLLLVMRFVALCFTPVVRYLWNIIASLDPGCASSRTAPSPEVPPQPELRRSNMSDKSCGIGVSKWRGQTWLLNPCHIGGGPTPITEMGLATSPLPYQTENIGIAKKCVFVTL